jgi:hypothetical protein
MNGAGLHPATLFVVTLCTGVQRGRQTVPDHALFGQVFKRRVQTLEAIKVVKDSLDDLIDNFVVDAASVYEEGLYIPIMKFADQGRVDETLIRIVRGNVREPDQVYWLPLATLHTCRRGSSPQHSRGSLQSACRFPGL